jgi:hypothetical protein
MLTFAAVMMFVVAGFEALAALFAFAGTGWWVTDMGNLVYANLVLWGIVDLVIALIALYAPVLAVVVIALCVMVIYGLAKHSDYFEGA